jgi:hypothetical protein
MCSIESVIIIEAQMLQTGHLAVIFGALALLVLLSGGLGHGCGED